MSNSPKSNMNSKRNFQQMQQDDEDELPKGVLQEEKYLEKMEKIIKRDFFPELKKLEDLQNPEQALIDSQDKDLKMNLNKFTQHVKSEDKEIVKDIIAKNQEQWNLDNWWVLLAEKKEKEAQLALKNQEGFNDIKKLQNPDLRMNRKELPPYIAANSVFFKKDGQKNKGAQDLDRKTYYENTRLPEQDKAIQISQQIKKKNIFNELQTLSTPALVGLRKQFEKEGKKYNLNSLRKNQNQSESVLSSQRQQDIQGYQLVDMPSPHPSQLASPLMTYGQLDDTPVRLDEMGQEIKGRNYDFYVEDPREKVAEQLSTNFIKRKQKLEQSQKDRQLQQIMKTVTPGSVINKSRSQRGSQALQQIMKMKSSQLGKSQITTPYSTFQTPKSILKNKFTTK